LYFLLLIPDTLVGSVHLWALPDTFSEEGGVYSSFSMCYTFYTCGIFRN